MRARTGDFPDRIGPCGHRFAAPLREGRGNGVPAGGFPEVAPAFLDRTIRRLTLLATLLLAPFAAPQAGVMEPPSHLLCEDLMSPTGIGAVRPRLSWWVLAGDARDVRQWAYQIVVASRAELLSPGQADLWDSGKRKDSSSACLYEGKSLAARQVCWWAVRTADGKGEWSPWSTPGRFELGLLHNEDWAGAKWICGAAPDRRHQHFYFRKAFSLSEKQIVRGRVYVSACHQHMLYVNGVPIGKGPNFAYPEHAYYQTFDIGPMLKPGSQNLLALRCHWFGGGQNRPTGRPGVILKAVIDLADGSVMEIHIGEGHYVADFGKVYTGRPQIDLTGAQPGAIL